MSKKILLCLEIIYNAVAIVFLVLAIAFIATEMGKTTPKRFLPLREEIVSTLDRGNVLLMDYMMDGRSEYLNFNKDEDELYKTVKKHLESYND